MVAVGSSLGGCHLLLGRLLHVGIRRLDVSCRAHLLRRVVVGRHEVRVLLLRLLRLLGLLGLLGLRCGVAVAVLVLVAAAAATAAAVVASGPVLVLVLMGVAVALLLRRLLGDSRAQRGEVLLEEGELRRVQQLRLRVDELDELFELGDRGGVHWGVWVVALAAKVLMVG